MSSTSGKSKVDYMFQTSYGCKQFLRGRESYPDLRHSQRYLREKLFTAHTLYDINLKAHYGCVNAIEFSNSGGEMIASGGDDRRVLLWNTQRAISGNGSPFCMKSEHRSNIFCLAFDKDNEKIFSGGNDEQVFVHDAATGNPVDNFMHEDAVYGLSTDPNNSNVFASACDDGRVLIYDIREPADSEPFCLANYVSSMHAVTYNPAEPRLLATANAREGVGLWDIRKPKSCLLRYGGALQGMSCMSVCINKTGNHLLALRRRMPPVIFNIHNQTPAVEFEHVGYFNSCTMKSCCFAGDKDQFVVSGSDDFNVFMWKIPDDLSERSYVNSAHLVLKGHRSIVNQVRYNQDNGLLISSGVEKTIKAWSAFPINRVDPEREAEVELRERPVYTHEEYINLVLRSGHVISHDYTQQSTEEDPRMMAFFDSLVQREMEIWSSNEDLTSSEEELYDRIMQAARRQGLDIESPRSSADGNSENSNDGLSPFTLAFASVMAAETAEQGNGSRLLDIEDSSDTDDSSRNTATVDGLNNNPNRRSISEIIAQKETLMRNMEAKKKLMASKSLLLKKRRFTSDSDSDSDEELKNTEIKKSKTAGSDQGECSTSVNRALINNSHKGKVKSHLKRLRNLRSQVLNSDSESNDNANTKYFEENGNYTSGASTSLQNLEPRPSNKNQTHASTSSSSISLVPLSCETLSTCQQNSANKFGPFLHETTSNDARSLEVPKSYAQASKKSFDSDNSDIDHYESDNDVVNKNKTSSKSKKKSMPNSKGGKSKSLKAKQTNNFSGMNSTSPNNVNIVNNNLKCDSETLKEDNCGSERDSSDDIHSNDRKNNNRRTGRKNERKSKNRSDKVKHCSRKSESNSENGGNNDNKSESDVDDVKISDRMCENLSQTSCDNIKHDRMADNSSDDKRNGSKSSSDTVCLSSGQTSASVSAIGSNRDQNWNVSEQQPTWNEFKRYKKTLERARRYYRRHSGSQPSSDDDM